MWTYAPAPANKLVGVFSSGAAVELMFAVFEGDLNGSAEDFTYHHQGGFHRVPAERDESACAKPEKLYEDLEHRLAAQPCRNALV